MYLEHFDLKDKPFSIAPSPRMLYLSETHDEGCARILYGIRESRGFVVVSGAVGLGKTTVLLSALEQLKGGVNTALIFNAVESYAQLLRMVCLEFGIDAKGLDEVEMLHALNTYLLDCYAEGDACVLLIDEAQNLSFELLESLRMLSNLQTQDSSLLQIVLVGQPELFVKLMDHRLLQLRQRVGVWHEIEPLGIEDTAEYIHHRLRLAGAPRPREIFDRDLCRLVHTLSGGVPRIVNQICDTSLVIAYGMGVKAVRSSDIREAATELRLADGPSSGTVVDASTEPATDRAVEPEPAPVEEARAETRDSDSARERRRWALGSLAAVIAVVLLASIVAADWIQPLRTALFSERGDATQPRAEAQPVPGVAASVVDEMPFDTEPVDQGLLEASGRFSAHVASFRDLTEAEAYARALAESNVGGSTPLLIEDQTADGGWFRVLVGLFLTANEARDFIAELRRDPSVQYAQLARVTGSVRRSAATPLPASVDGSEPG